MARLFFIVPLIVLVGLAGFNLDNSYGAVYQFGPEPPAAGFNSPNSMNQLPTPSSAGPNFNPLPAPPKEYVEPACDIDSSLMKEERAQNPNSNVEPGRPDKKSGAFRCTT